MIYIACFIWFTLTILAWLFILAKGRKAATEPEPKHSERGSAFEPKPYANSVQLDSGAGV